MPDPLVLVRILASRPRPVRFLLARLLARTGLSRRLTIRRDGYRLRFFPTSLSSALWELGPNERREEEQLIARLLQPGDTYVDVGANVGALTIVGRQAVTAAGTVVAIEAHPTIFGYLRENLKLNGLEAALHNCAVGEEEGELRFSESSQDDQNKVVTETHTGITVPVRRLDDIVDGIEHVRLLKVDVEGFELAVFMGAPRTLERTEVILFECWEKHTQRYGYSPAEVIVLLSAKGFRIFRENGELVSSETRFPICENLVAIGRACRDPGPVIAMLH
jgi:FkbM family methyltransferase